MLDRILLSVGMEETRSVAMVRGELVPSPVRCYVTLFNTRFRVPEVVYAKLVALKLAQWCSN